MSIEFNKLKDVDSTPLFKEYANSCWEESSKSLIRKYNSIRIKRCGITASLRSEYSYEYQTICKDNARKFLIVNIENDSVIIPLKRVQMFKYIYNRLDGFPISLSGLDFNTGEMDVNHIIASTTFLFANYDIVAST